MEWKEVTIKEITSVLGDGLHGTPRYDENGDYFFINGNNLSNGHIEIKNDTKRVNHEEFSKHKKELNNRTILVSINGTIGNVAKYNGEKCILGKSACYFNVKDGIDRDFVYYVVSSPIFIRDIANQATGTTIKNVSLKQMREYKFMIPNLLDDQRRISSILSSLDRKIELNNKINATLEEMAQALFKSWFVDFEPFKNGNFIDTEIGKIPEGWRVGTLFDVADVLDSKRKPLSSRQRDAMQKIYPYYGATCCMDYVDDYLFDGIYTLIGEDGSVVKENGLPYMQYVWGKIWVNNHAHVLQGKNGFSTELLHCMLSLTPINHLVTGAVQAKLSQGNMKKIQIAIPPMEVLKQIVPKIDELYNQLRINSQETLTLTHLRDTLLPRLMSGEIEL